VSEVWSDHLSSVFSVTALQRQLADDPRRLLWRTLLVRGEARARGCREEAGTLVLCTPRQVVLTDPGPTLTDTALPLVLVRPDPLLSVVRHLPLRGRVLPPPQVVHWRQVAIYRVQLRALADTAGGRASYEALLLDAAPVALGEG
jgi:hypothetical protein